MAMDIQDMVAAMLAKNEAFRGNEQVPEKVEVFNKLKEHGAAIGKTLRTPWHADDLELREQNAFVSIDFPLRSTFSMTASAIGSPKCTGWLIW